jgi:UDP:flavonoid glycosyltransferase YjiC (YdhE family)
VIKFLYRLVDFVVDPLIAGPINQTRAELGLPPVKRIMGDYWHSPRLTLGLWPDWYAPPQKDWPASLRLTGFPLYDGAGLENTSPGLKEFLEEGSPPLVFTGGSAMRRGQKFFFESAKAAQILGCRAALITQFPDQLPKNLPPGVRHFSYLPFSQIFPHAAVIVHHGGIGTTSQALKSGRPQLIVPFSNDQPDNAARVKKLGAGDFLSPSAYRANKVAARLEGLMADTSLQQRCRNIVSQLDPSALERTCDLIEQLRTA